MGYPCLTMLDIEYLMLLFYWEGFC